MKLLRFTAIGFALPLLTWCGFAQAEPAQLPAACQRLIASTYPAWKPVAPAADVRAWAKSQKFNPVVAAGDFDRNGLKDWATIGAEGKSRKVVLCLSFGATKRLVVADDDGCTDLIYSLSAGATVFNYEVGKEEVLQRDSAATSCFDKSGRVFSLENGEFNLKAIAGDSVPTINSTLLEMQQLMIKIQDAVNHYERSPQDILFQYEEIKKGPGEK